MAGRYRPFRNIRRADDLLLAKRKLTRTPATVRMPTDPYYPEICVWVNVRCDDTALLPATGRALLQLKLRASDYFHQVQGAVTFGV